ncbi:MAG: NAD(+)/NADH kinase [Clostridium sp.]|nr:NAD(+)/NADH kinase [Acetatifactor muris]MCM1527013.1 NAD(+)/NADH kinase [Bacteroides sp.]MCM1561989.1 NAD(+)/NADH kinase [Clostridium sp.]
MKHFLIYTNKNKDRDLRSTNQIKGYLECRGQKVTLMIKESDWTADTTEESEEAKNIPKDVDCMIVLGGDGTVLQAARETKKLFIPIIGVNLGTLGYMTEIEPANLEESLDKLIEGEYTKESRMMLNGKVTFHCGKPWEEGWALNDIVISRRGSIQMLWLDIYVNGQFLHRYKADGMIVATPTGSSSYSLSAGGPLVEPSAKIIMLTAICPHSLNHRSIVLSPEDVIEIEVPAGREGRKQTVEANFDGSHKISMCTGDRIRIVQSEKITEFLRLNQVSFMETLHKKFSE